MINVRRPVLTDFRKRYVLYLAEGSTMEWLHQVDRFEKDFFVTLRFWKDEHNYVRWDYQVEMGRGGTRYAIRSWEPGAMSMAIDILNDDLKDTLVFGEDPPALEQFRIVVTGSFPMESVH